MTVLQSVSRSFSRQGNLKNFGFTLLTGIFVAAAITGLVIHALSPAIFPDEMAFLDILLNAIRSCHSKICVAKNSFGYGSLWWEIFRVLIYATGTQDIHLIKITVPTIYDTALRPIYAMRLLSVAAIVAAILYAAITLGTTVTRRAFILLFLVSPIIWWNGRWAGPDIMGTAATIAAIALYLNNRLKLALVFFGVATALRLSNGLALAGFIGLTAKAILDLPTPKLGKKFILIAGSLLLGYVLTNPDCLVDPSGAFVRARGVGPTSDFSWNKGLELLQDMMWAKHREWDFPSTGSLIYFWGGALSAVMALFIAFVCEGDMILLASLSGIIICTAAILVRHVGYGWYLMVNIAATYIAMAATLKFPVASARLKGVLYAMLAVGYASAINTAWAEIRFYESRAHQNFKGRKDIACVQAALADRKPTQSLFISVDPVITLIPLSDDNIMPMANTVSMMDQADKNHPLTGDYLVVSNFTMLYNHETRVMGEAMLGHSQIVPCGKYKVLISIPKKS